MQALLDRLYAEKRFRDVGNPVQVEREPEEVESANAALVFDLVVGEGVETPEKEDGGGDDGDVDDELLKSEVVKSVVVALKDVLLERLQGNYRPHVLDVLRWDGDHSYEVSDDFLSCLDGDPEFIRQDL